MSHSSSNTDMIATGKRFGNFFNKEQTKCHQEWKQWSFAGHFGKVQQQQYVKVQLDQSHHSWQPLKELALSIQITVS